jgi:alpha-beta hydrolase superfamily lysophospholipase
MRINDNREDIMGEAIDKASTRRTVIGQLATSGALVMAAAAADSTTAQAQTPPRTFVLVHGAYEGGWIWRYVADRLRAKGHKVFTPTHTGLGERSHLMSGLITLDTHITDVSNVIKWEHLENVVLAGHSYGGWVISGVVERMLPKIASIVYIDAFFPENGQKGLDLSSESSRVAVLNAISKGDVSRPPDYLRENSPMMTPQDREWLVSNATQQPIGVSLHPLTLTGARDKVAKKAYIRARGNPNATYDAAYAKLQSDKSWRLYEVACGHSVMIDMPDRLTEILLEMA